MLQNEIERIQMQIAAAEKQLADLPQPTDAEPKDVIVAVQRRTLERQTLAKREDIEEVIAQFKKQLTEKQQQLERQRQRQRQQEARFRVDKAINEIEDISAELAELRDRQRELLIRANNLTKLVRGDFLTLNPRPPYPDSINYRSKMLVVSGGGYVPSAPAILQGDSQNLFYLQNQAI